MFHIHFFEEFPTEQTLLPAACMTSGTIYLAAHSFEQFLQKQELLRSINPNVQAAYWPLLKESYWFSPYSHPHELASFYDELCLRDEHLPPLNILLDLELPFLRRHLFRENRKHARNNRHLLERIFEDASRYRVTLHTAEYPSLGGFSQRLFQRLGISYPTERFAHQKIMMWYTSMIPLRLRALAQRGLRWSFERYKDQLSVGIGTISHGIFGNEPLLSPLQMHEDLLFLQKIGIKNVVIFRLGGMTRAYWEILQPFSINPLHFG
jgi:hypothetical protein